jgi:hypothetical protein
VSRLVIRIRLLAMRDFSLPVVRLFILVRVITRNPAFALTKLLRLGLHISLPQRPQIREQPPRYPRTPHSIDSPLNTPLSLLLHPPTIAQVCRENCERLQRVQVKQKAILKIQPNRVNHQKPTNRGFPSRVLRKLLKMRVVMALMLTSFVGPLHVHKTTPSSNLPSP